MFVNLASGTRTHNTVRANSPVAAAACCGNAPYKMVFAVALMTLAAAGCYKRSVLPQPKAHEAPPAANPSSPAVPQPARTSVFAPPPNPAVKAPTYSVVVNEVPVKELLFALARDTKQNI